jgi:potassium channel subfamily K
MATGAKESDEQPIRPDSRDQPVTTNDDAGKRNSANEVVGDLDKNEMDVWEAEKAGEGYFVPLRIWCASVIFPISAGSFGPMASAFGICALAESWRVENLTKAADDMLVGTDIAEPKW